LGAGATESPRIAVAVINHNTMSELRTCLLSVAAENPVQVIVVDTGSNDGSVAMVSREFPAVELIVTSNGGYGAGANAALERVRMPHVLLLNSDTSVHPGALAVLDAYLERNPRVAVAGPSLIDSGGRAQQTAYAFPTPGRIFIRETGLHYLLRPRQADADSARAEWVLGAALALRTKAVQEVGGFDESYFMYNEELDLCLRFRRAGWEVHYVPMATVMHLGGASTKKKRAAMAAQYVRSTMLLYENHMPRAKLTELRLVLGLTLSARLVRDHVLAAVSVPRSRRQEFTERIDAWKGSLAALRERT
jgi:N-acetylglucosaminyl-diphospho-decaprenol L-rhamnosyltransferase